MSDITSMHDTASPAEDLIRDPFRRVTITHLVRRTFSKEETDQRTPHNAAMVTMRLADGGYITVWPSGMVQVSNYRGVKSANYQTDTVTPALILVDPPWETTEG